MSRRIAVFAFSLVLAACTSSPDPRPELYSKGERYLSSGLIHYKKDNFSAAQINFYRALMLYQSVDHSTGTQLARINLLESLLALNDFTAAEEHLDILKHQKTNTELSERIILLETKLLFKKQLYSEALATIEALLLALNQREKIDNKQLEWLATAARLESLVATEAKYLWVTRYRTALLKKNNVQAKFQVALKRIDANIATQNQQYPKALGLLHEALGYYKSQGHRRAIAACYEEMAAIENKQQHHQQELKYLKRALTIRIWLKDQYHIDIIQKKL